MKSLSSRARAAVWLAAAGCNLIAHSAGAETIKDERLAMGSRFEITVIHEDTASGWQAIEAAWSEIDRLEALISSWLDSSETSAVNRRAGLGPVQVSPELLGLTRRSLKISALTGGAFDITFAPLTSLWDLRAEPPRLPTDEAVRATLETVGYHLVDVDTEARTIALTRTGARIGFGAIGKGFAANSAVRLLRARGIEAGVVSAGGDLFAFGLREDGRPWTVAIADPLRPDHLFATLQVSEQAVVTSGDYESYVEIDGRRYSHILDPRTGYPVEGVRSATVVCADAELADGLATAVSVLGVRDGLALIDRLDGVEALLVDQEGTLHFSKNLRRQLVMESE